MAERASGAKGAGEQPPEVEPGLLARAPRGRELVTFRGRIYF